MSSNKSLIGTASGIVEAPYEQIAALLLNVNTGKVAGSSIPFFLSGLNVPANSVTLDIQGGPEKFSVFSTGAHTGRLVYLEVIKKQALIAIYGGYWYRGEYQLVRHNKGCLIKLSNYNIAPGLSRIFVPFLKEYREISKEYQRTPKRNTAFDHFLQRFAVHLDCKAYSL